MKAVIYLYQHRLSFTETRSCSRWNILKAAVEKYSKVDLIELHSNIKLISETKIPRISDASIVFNCQ